MSQVKVVCIAIFLFVLSMSACGEGDTTNIGDVNIVNVPDKVCTPGDVRTCSLPGEFGVCKVGKQVCYDDGSGWDELCQYQVYPGTVAETCSDSIDNDCDGFVNEDCDEPCAAGQTIPCNSSFDGVCQRGTRMCLPDETGYGECIPVIMPGQLAEVCADGDDNDCDGLTDENCPGSVCDPLDPPVTCNTNFHGVCQPGLMACLSDGTGYMPCVANITPNTLAEVCGDGDDNDCDGSIDENCLGTVCSVGDIVDCDTGYAGVCEVGSMECLADQSGWNTCEAIVLPGVNAEICGDGLDNDCNGVIDDGCTCVANVDTVDCNTNLPGFCANGLRTCLPSGDGWGSCVPNVLPGAVVEVCGDGDDNDCDGLTDENCPGSVCDPTDPPVTCNTNFHGVCQPGLMACLSDGTGYMPCVANITPNTLAEVCGDGDDNDCDGSIDENCLGTVCSVGDIVDCDTGYAGVCEVGSMECLADQSGWNTCEAIVLPGVNAEICGDGLDNDCNGVIDDGCTCVANVDTVDCNTNLPGFCANGLRTCLPSGDGWGSCVPNVLPGAVVEVCGDGDDNDCDGLTDENCPGSVCDPLDPPVTCNTNFHGVCQPGLMACLSDGTGYMPCVANITPNTLAEVCGDGDDNDCDGSIDENCLGTVCSVGDIVDCDTGYAGVCEVGSMECLADQSGWNTCEAIVLPGVNAEICGDGLDNDCNGVIDDGCTCVANVDTVDCNTNLPGFCANGLRTCLPSGDGWGSCVPNVLPGAVVEVCGDGDDNDCDGLTDENCPGSVCDPLDPPVTCNTNFHGVCQPGLMACLSDGTGYMPCVANITPNTLAEVCGDGDDNDCDGSIDENCLGTVCSVGDIVDCDTGYAGVCEVGSMECLADQSGWNTCEAIVLPGVNAEICGDGLDNDCNGVIDDGCTCVANVDTVDCNTNLPGFCANGLRTCLPSGDGWGSCVPNVLPGAVVEVCGDGDDNDCDGLTDENCPGSVCDPLDPPVTCNTNFHGVCQPGLMACLSDGTGYMPCVANITPNTLAEVCGDGDDNDCDGSIDENCLGTVCSVGDIVDCDTGYAGVCEVGSMECLADQSGWNTCEAIVLPGVNAEICGDGLDNDCNGVIDDGCTCVANVDTVDCNTNLPGFCANGLRTCLPSGDGWGSCVPNVLPGAVVEVCGDGDDNDCDGLTDENCPGSVCDPLDPPVTCNTNFHGVCQPGLMACLSDGTGYMPCVANITPNTLAEVCGDGDDNDCDGSIDENCLGTVCSVGDIVDCDTGYAGVCEVGSMECLADQSGWNTCEAIVLPGVNAEICGDGLDNDCNGVIDDGCTCVANVDTVDCNTNLPGFCANGLRTCLPSGDGWGSCVPNVLPGAVVEVCGDGDDNDCDGVVDEGCTCVPGTPITCNTGFYGECAEGESKCLSTGDGWGPCLGVQLPYDASEICTDGDDNDCDGAIDENCPAMKGDITCTDIGGGMVQVVVNGQVRSGLVSSVPGGETASFMELGCSIGTCWDPGTDCYQQALGVDGTDHAFTLPYALLTPRIETDFGTEIYLDLAQWNVLGDCTKESDPFGGFRINAT